VLFRSVRLGLLAAIPNTTPMAVTLGYMGLRGYDLNAGNVIVFTICLGIVVDDTIHFLTRYREEMARDNDVWKAIERSYHGTGRAIVLMTLLIVCGLSVLLLSDFVPTRRFAELTTLTMIAALFGDLLLLPASLVLFRKRERTRKDTPEDNQNESGEAVPATHGAGDKPTEMSSRPAFPPIQRAWLKSLAVRRGPDGCARERHGQSPWHAGRARTVESSSVRVTLLTSATLANGACLSFRSQAIQAALVNFQVPRAVPVSSHLAQS
jgi:multidrug efflux pump subunit AcrB